MLGKKRVRTRSQAQIETSFAQRDWGGGENSDDPASEIDSSELSLLTNAVDYGKYIEGHGGSLRLASTALPGSGTVHDLKFHPTAKKFLLMRGTQAWVASATVGSWTELKTTAKEGFNNFSGAGLAGDTTSALTASDIRRWINGVNSSNSTNGLLYWDFTKSGTTRDIEIYKTLTLGVKSDLVASGSAEGNNALFFYPRNDSGIYGAFSKTNWSIDDTDSGNIFTCDIEQSALKESKPCKIELYKNDFIVFSGLMDTAYKSVLYIDLTRSKVYCLGAGAGVGYPTTRTSPQGAQSPSTPYGRRYLVTYSTLTDQSGTLNRNTNRKDGRLLFESPCNNNTKNINAPTYYGGYPDHTNPDYCESWFSDPITPDTPNTFPLYDDTDFVSIGSLGMAMTPSSHYTHFTIYGTKDIGSAGVNATTGLGNNSEVFVWLDDIEIGSEEFLDYYSDAVLNSRIKAGLTLRTRYWQEIPEGECGCIVNDFLFMAARGSSKLYYQQLLHPEHMGFYRPDAQFMTFDDGIQLLEESQDQVSVICSTQTWKVNPKIISNIDQISSVFTINSRFPASKSIGVTDWGSLQKTENGGFIARCSDGSIRAWNGSAWGQDYGESKVRGLLLGMIDGSASAYYKNAYYLWYRTTTGSAYNNNCLRLGLGGDAGFGWSRISRATWIYPHLRVGGIVVLDDTNLARLMVLDYSTGNIFWIETFTNSGSSFTKAWKDKENVSGGTDFGATLRLREFTGQKEHHTLYHEESHAYFRPAIPADGYLADFSVGLNIYADGATTPVATATGVPRDGDIQLSKVASGRRLMPEITTTTSKFQLVGYDSDIIEQDRATIGAGFSDTAEATNQLNLASNLKQWLCRPRALLNRVTGTNYTLTGTAPTAVTGPDGKAYALSFPSGASYSQAFVLPYTNFSICFWVKSVQLNKQVFIINGSPFSYWVVFTSNTELYMNEDGDGGGEAISSVASGWHNFWLVAEGGFVTTYKNGAAIDNGYSHPMPAGPYTPTTFQINPDGGTMILDDIRVYNNAKTAADIAYYYNDVINNAGKIVMPLG